MCGLLYRILRPMFKLHRELNIVFPIIKRAKDLTFDIFSVVPLILTSQYMFGHIIPWSRYPSNSLWPVVAR